MVIDMDLYLDIYNITKKDYDARVIKNEERVIVRNINEILEDLIEYIKEV